ncbi:MAG: S41 family peptidase [Oscillospiraceae bacterium]|nr:S41 family peptidase [Oscillospiraceae bacterium]
MKGNNSGNSRMLVAVICTGLLTFSATYSFLKIRYYNNYKEYMLLAEAENIVTKNFYYDSSDREKLVDSAVGGYISGLNDRYSRYQSIKQTEERNDTHAGLKVGIGITVSLMDDGYMEVIEVGDNSPASKAGIKVSDIIRKVDGNDVSETGYNESVDYIRNGEENSIVVITVDRNGTESDIEVKREKIEIITASCEMADDRIGHISITQFNDKTPEQTRKCFEECLEKGAEGIIFDVRNNGGGLVTAVEECLDPLIPEGDIAVAVYRDGEETVIVRSDAEETDVPMAVLVNENSASGAELFAACLRDFKGAELIGKTTFGKGIMQDTFSLSNGSSVVLTVAEYKTTKSECYHEKGLVPDIEAEQGTDEDTQLKAALECIKKKIN